jgi:hypothetical protein
MGEQRCSKQLEAASSSCVDDVLAVVAPIVKTGKDFATVSAL